MKIFIKNLRVKKMNIIRKIQYKVFLFKNMNLNKNYRYKYRIKIS